MKLKKDQNEVHPVLHSDEDGALHITQRQNGNWYYQRRIPVAVQPFYKNKTSIKLSLRTGSKLEACRRARALSVQYDQEFADYQKQLNPPASKSLGHSLSLSELHKRHETVTMLALFAAKAYVGTQELFTFDYQDKAQREAYYTGLEENLDLLLELAERITESSISDREVKTSRVWGWLDASLTDELRETLLNLSVREQHQFVVEAVTHINKWLRMLIGKRQYPMANVELPDIPKDYLNEITQSSDSSSTNTDTGKLLSECIKLYLEAKQQDGVRAKTLDQCTTRLALLVYVLGDRAVNSFTRQDALTFKDKVLSLPANRNKRKEYKGLSVDELIKLNPEPMSHSTANGIFTEVNALFDWCVINEIAHRNAFKKLKVKVTRKASEIRSEFKPEDLKVLFGHDYFQGQKTKHPYYYWLPLLGLYTGARLNELCQLYKDDIAQDVESGLWFINITDKRDDQQLKNRSSLRTIPVHSKLIELGFIDYVQSIKAERLFPELKLQRDGYQQAASKWFARFRNTVLPNAKQEGKTFHSFRHTVANSFKQQGVNKAPVAAILGHGEDSETYGRYGKAFVMDVLKPVIERLSYDIEVKPWVIR